MSTPTHTASPSYFNPGNATTTATMPASLASNFATAPGVAAAAGSYYLYGINLNFIGAALFPQVASTFNALQASLLNVDASNPAQLLQIQLLMSEYENTVQSTSQMYASLQSVIKAIIQNL